MSLSPQVCKKSYKVKIPTLGENCEFWLITVTDESGITNPNKDHAYLTDSGKLYIYNGKTLIQVNCDICFTQEERDKLEGIEEGANKYVLPVATDNALGGIKTGFTQTEKQYAIEVTEEGQAYVTVPWTDTVYTLPVADTDTLGGVKLGYSQNGKNYPVVKDSEGNIYVAVPWEEYNLPQAETNTLGGIKTGYEQQGKNYPVLVDVDGNAYVNVPWTDTDTKYNVVSTTENGLAPMLPNENADKKFLNGEGEWVEVNESINGNTVTGSTFSGETSDCGVQILEVQGKTVQQTTNGYQLFDASKLPSKSDGGANVINNEDGSYTIGGSGSLSTVFNHYVTLTKEETLKIFKKGTLFGKVDSSVAPYPSFLVYANGKYTELNLPDTNLHSIEITEEMLNADDLYSRLRFYSSSGSTIKAGTIKPMLYQDGDGTWEPYTGGKPAPNPDYAMEIENVNILKINSRGRNLFNNEEAINGKAINDKGVIIENPSWSLSDYIRIKPMTKYSFNGVQSTYNTNNLTVRLYNEDKEYLSYLSVAIKSSTGETWGSFTSSENAYYMQFCIKNDEKEGVILSQGEVIPYEPYIDTTVETSLSLAEGDTYENGQITRVRKQVVFDGSSDESWFLSSSVKKRMIIGIIDAKASQRVKCNRFIPSNVSTEKLYECYLDNNNNFYINSQFETIEEWKTWLQSHPLTVEYELETPTTEEFKVPTIPSYEPYTEISTNSVVDPTITFRPLPFTTCLVGEATEEENGLMSSTDKSRLDQLWAKFDSMVFFTED